MSFVHERIISKKDIESISKIYHGKEAARIIKKLAKRKIKVLVITLVIAVIVTVILYAKSSREAGNIRTLKRDSLGGNDKDITLYVSDEAGLLSSEKINFKLSETGYSDEEILELKEAFFSELKKLILSGNESFNEVRNNLNFVSYIEGYPFNITYSTDNPLLLSSKGVIDFDRLEETENLVNIKCKITYDDFEEIEIISVKILEKKLSEKEKFIEDIKEEINLSERKYKSSDVFILPESVENKKIIFSKKLDYSWIIFGILIIISGFAVFEGLDEEINKKVKERDQEFLLEYPIFVNKFALYMNAGMPVKAVWIRMCADYDHEFKRTKRKKYFYEEMLITKKLMEEGKSELMAYEDFAERSCDKNVRRFISIINQSVLKGQKDVNQSLYEEAAKAFTERKNNARKACEEAGTKLLIPMFIMLMIVILIIVYPAFCNF